MAADLQAWPPQMLLPEVAMYFATSSVIAWFWLSLIHLVEEGGLLRPDLAHAVFWWLVLFWAHCAMTAHAHWRRTPEHSGPDSGCAWLSLSFYVRMMRECCVSSMIVVAICMGALLEKFYLAGEECSAELGKYLWPLLLGTVIEYLLMTALIMDAQVEYLFRLFPRRLFRRRTGWHLNFVAGCVIGMLMWSCIRSSEDADAEGSSNATKCFEPRCGADRFCVGFEEDGNVYCYGWTVGCKWNRDDCRADSDCAQYNQRSPKFTDGDQPLCDRWRRPSGWRASACACDEFQLGMWASYMLAALIVVLGVLPIGLARNAAVYGELVVFFAWITTTYRYCQFWIYVLEFLPITLLALVAGTAETARDSRSVLSLTVVIVVAIQVGGKDYNDSSRALLLFSFCGGYGVRHYMRCKRDMRSWSKAIKFLKFSEIKRRRKAVPGFILDRRQAMDREIYGDPTRAQYIIAVSHAWLSPGHADPEGRHLDLLISRLKERFHSDSSAPVDRNTEVVERICKWWWLRIWKWWWRYYFMRAEGDVLVFFDMSSLPQVPRTPQETDYFREALGLMNFMYHSFEVLIIPDIPDHITHHGHYLTYMDKGWCWAEVQIANIGGKVELLSERFAKECEQEQERRQQHGLSLSEALAGYPPFPQALMQRGCEDELMSFRKTQLFPGKIFTNGKFDMDHVADILTTVERKQQLRTFLEDNAVADVKALFNNRERIGSSDSVTSARSGPSRSLGSVGCRSLGCRQELANAVFDGNFTTPLHLAVAAGSVELVEFLLEAGARPRRNFNGHLPWERHFLPRFSAAARAAQVSQCNRRHGSMLTDSVIY